MTQEKEINSFNQRLQPYFLSLGSKIFTNSNGSVLCGTDLLFIKFILEEFLQRGFVWQLEHVGRDKELVVHAGKSVFHHLLAFAGA